MTSVDRNVRWCMDLWGVLTCARDVNHSIYPTALRLHTHVLCAAAGHIQWTVSHRPATGKLPVGLLIAVHRLQENRCRVLTRLVRGFCLYVQPDVALRSLLAFCLDDDELRVDLDTVLRLTSLQRSFTHHTLDNGLSHPTEDNCTRSSD